MAAKAVELYLVSSPIYYPLFNWWEYDFRYRNDMKANVVFNGISQEARITDIRRNAACITIFEKLPIGSSIVVKLNDNKNALIMEARVISVRETSLGRGFSYGISFSWGNDSTNEYYKQLKNSWSEVKVNNRRDRFDSSSINVQ